MSELASKLREYNDWRRGALISQPAPVELGQAIDAAIVAIEQRDDLLAAAEAIEINAEECLDFDECTAMLIPIDDYHKLMEAIASAKDHFRDATKMIARSKPTAP